MINTLMCATLVAGLFLGQGQAVKSSAVQQQIPKHVAAASSTQENQPRNPMPANVPRVHGHPGKRVAAFWMIVPRKG